MADSVEGSSSLAEIPQESRSRSRGGGGSQQRVCRCTKVDSTDGRRLAVTVMNKQEGPEGKREKTRLKRRKMQRNRVEGLRRRKQCCDALHFGEPGDAAAVSHSPSISIAFPLMGNGCGMADHIGVDVVCAT